VRGREKSPPHPQIRRGAKYAKSYLKHIIDGRRDEYPTIPIAIHCDHGDPRADSGGINDGYTVSD